MGALRTALTTVLAGGAFGCSVGEVGESTDADTGSTHALVTIERSEALGETPSAGAIAGFAQLPAAVDAESVLKLVGLDLELPSVNHCTRQVRDEVAPTAPSAPVEFLEAGDVAISAADSRTILAPRALPTVADVISGVVYTTRDQHADSLPMGEEYLVRVSGGPVVAAFHVTAEAPAPIVGVTLGGVPLTEMSTISADGPIDLTWSVGQSDDLLYVELATLDGESSVGCTFRDDIGAGTIPQGLFEGRGEARLAMRRIRAQLFNSGVENGELRFDFEFAVPVDVQ
jgi:hypothetical protein